MVEREVMNAYNIHSKVCMEILKLVDCVSTLVWKKYNEIQVGFD